MEDTGENLSSKELQLISQNNYLKKQMKEMEELYAAEDEKSYQVIQKLKQEQKELKATVENLQTRIFNAENLSPSPSPSRKSFPSASPPFQRPSSHSPSPAKLKHNTSVLKEKSFNNTSLPNINENCSLNSNLNDSLLEDYENLQDNFKTLSDQKAQLEAKVRKLNEQIKALQETIEDLRLKENAREEHIQKMEAAYDELRQNNEELYKTVCQLQKEIDDLQSFSRFNESPMSLYDELEEIKQREFQQDDSILPEFEAVLPETVDEESSKESSNIFEKEIEEKEVVYKIVEPRIVQKKRTSFLNGSLIRVIAVILFLFIYATLCVQFDKPILWFVSSHHFNTRLVTVRMPPM